MKRLFWAWEWHGGPSICLLYVGLWNVMWERDDWRRTVRIAWNLD